MKIRIDENYRFSRFDYESSCIFTSRQSMIDCDQELSSLDSTVFIAEMLQPVIWNVNLKSNRFIWSFWSIFNINLMHE